MPVKVAYGVVGAVVYAIHGDDFDGRPVHIGDTYSAEAAREVVQRLSFETGYYSRCWEISSAHISHETGQYLANLADLATPEAFLFIAFRVPYSPAIGVKLISTPWTDQNLEDAEEHLRRAASAGALQQGHAGRPGDRSLHWPARPMCASSFSMPTHPCCRACRWPSE
jgi:hypothetical protein